MSLRLRLALIFIGMVLLTLLITTGLAYYELISEPSDPDAGEENHDETMGWRLTEIVLRGAGPVILLALIAWWLTQRMLRPIETLTEATENLAKGGYGAQIPMLGKRDELARLTAAFNDMSKQVATSFQRIREFTLHASHELKTPLTVLRTSLEWKIPHTSIGSSERDELASMLDEVHRLTKIVDSLSLLTKADARLLYCEQLPVELGPLVSAAKEDAEALAEGQELTIILDHCDSALIQGDRHRLRQLLLILTDNAVKYNNPGGKIILSLEVRNSEAVLTISNTGNGLAQAKQGQVFDRFFRGDEVQGQNIEGSGLGLSIALWIVESHSGEITFKSDPEWTVVTATFPLAQPT